MTRQLVIEGNTELGDTVTLQGPYADEGDNERFLRACAFGLLEYGWSVRMQISTQRVVDVPLESRRNTQP